jgi:hypothetical protein
MTTDRPDGEPIEDLADLLARIDPAQRPGEFVFVTVDSVDVVPFGAEATVVEDGRVSCVVTADVATSLGRPDEPRLAWITLRVHSSLTAVGLTAAVAGALAERGIAANVIAGHRHDHVLVPVERADEALAAIGGLAQR